MVWPAIIAAGASIVGGIMGNQASAGEASKARDWSADQYARRYQTTMADMRAAGLNPMLAYSQGPGQAPTAQGALQGDFGGASAASAIAQAEVRESGKKQADSQTELNTSSAKQAATQAELNKEKTRESKETQAKIFQERQKIGAQTALTERETQMVTATLDRMKRTGDGPLGKIADLIYKMIKGVEATAPASAQAIIRGKKIKGPMSQMPRLDIDKLIRDKRRKQGIRK